MPLFAKALELLLPNGTDRYIGLLLAEPDVVAGTYDELADSGYSRITHAAWVSADNGDGRLARRNSGAIVFDAIVDAAATVTHWAVFDAAAAGNIIAAGPVLNSEGVAQPAEVGVGDQARFNDGDLELLSSEVEA